MTEDGDGRKIFIAKIKLGTLENEVLDVCKKLDVGNVDAITFRLARKGTFGFAEFATAEDANKAIEELDGMVKISAHTHTERRNFSLFFLSNQESLRSEHNMCTRTWT